MAGILKGLCCCVFAAATAAGAAEIHVALTGDDTGPGTVERPLATLRQAVMARRAVDAGEPVTIVLHDGIHHLTEPLVFGATDGGTEPAPVVVTARPGVRPVVSGGRRLKGWSVRDGRWVLTIPEVRSGAWNFIDLFVDGQRRPRARLPKSGWFKVAGELPPSGRGQGVDFGTPQVGDDQFRFHPGDIRGDWHALGDVEVLVSHMWRLHRLRIAEVAGDQVRFTGATGAGHISGKMPAGASYVVENVREALSEPGEWYLDRASGELTYVPKPGEDPERSLVVAPVLDHLLRLDGASDVVMRGLTFAHALWATPPHGHCFPQAEADVPAAIRLNRARRCRFESCDITLVGGYGIDLGPGTTGCVLDDCEITHLGAGGVRIGAGQFGQPDAGELASGNEVRQCLIAHGGRLHPAAVGVWIGHSPHNTLEHCDIHDFYYTGVSLGWSWGYQPSQAHHNTIAHCHISLIGQKVLSDMGGIYTLGNGPGNVLRGNHIHDVACRPGGYGGWGLYHDEGSSGFVSEDNLVHDTSSTTFHQHYGRENIIRNNIFAFGHEGGLARTREEEHVSFRFEKNIVLTAGSPIFVSNWTNGRFELKSNVYWDTRHPELAFPGGRNFSDWQTATHDTSVLADPRFRDAAARDFRLADDSPALAQGFRPIKTGQPGQTGRQRPRRLPADAVPPAWPE